MESVNPFTMLNEIARAQSKRFPEGDDCFKIGCRMLEECGEVVWELNHYERKGISLDRGNSEQKEHMALEAFQLVEVTMQLMQYFDLTTELRDVIAKNYYNYVDKGLIIPEKQ